MCRPAGDETGACLPGPVFFLGLLQCWPANSGRFGPAALGLHEDAGDQLVQACVRASPMDVSGRGEALTERNDPGRHVSHVALRTPGCDVGSQLRRSPARQQNRVWEDLSAGGAVLRASGPRQARRAQATLPSGRQCDERAQDPSGLPTAASRTRIGRKTRIRDLPSGGQHLLGGEPDGEPLDHAVAGLGASGASEGIVHERHTGADQPSASSPVFDGTRVGLHGPADAHRLG